MSNCNSQKPIVNRTTPSKDMYWFAQTSDPSAEETSPMKNSSFSKKEDGKESLLQKEREERVRLFKEQQEEERRKRQQELEQSFMVSKKYREQQEAERRRKIEEARVREDERRQQVEERKRQIWEAEQERKEAILRRNLEREARIEARRNAHRNSMSFAFGSSTPRTFDLDLAALGGGRGPAEGSVLMSAVSGRRSEEREFGAKRATSACSLDRKFEGEDMMSRSMVSLSSVSRGRRRTDLTPTVPRDRSTTPILISRGKQSLRAVSMTRLDQLAQPRRRYAEPPKDSTMIGSPTKSKMASPSMSKSMCNLADSSISSHSSRLTLHMPSARGDSSMSRSMMHLPDSASHRGRTTSPRPSPTSPKPMSPLQPALRSAQSMIHLAITPRPTRATRLRANAVASAKDGRTASMLNLSKPEIYANGRFTMSVMKDNSQSPSRPHSSMSRTSEISTTSSQASGVMMRPKPAPRRPRPVSIAGTTVGSSSAAAPASASKRPERPTRPTEKTAPKTSRAKSAEPDQRSEETANSKSTPKKPVPPPKTSEILAKAKSRPVPSKDNLRKRVASAEPAKKTAADSQTKNVPPSESEIKVLPSSEPEMKNLPSQHEEETSPPSEPQLKNVPLPEHERKPSPELEVKNPVPLESEVKNTPTSETEIKSLSPSVLEVVSESAGSVLRDEEQGAADKPVTSLTNNQQTVENGVQPVVQEHGEKTPEQPVEATPSKARITSEEEARAALAEKRRLAREQAEREAELERQRQEELRRQEEERQRQEELEQKRLEEEQIRLSELHRKLEEEKLRKAIEEQQQREKEERERKEEEARLKAEKEEQERKAREEAERQRLELEERLRKEEEERAERKRRVEQIMSRTRARANQSGTGSQPNSQSASKPTTPAEESKVSPPSDNPPVISTSATVTSTTGISATTVQDEFSNVLVNQDTTGNKCIDISIITHENNVSNKADSATSIQTEILQPNSDNTTGNHVEQLQNLLQNPVVENGHHKESVEFPFEKTDVTLGVNHSSNRTSECIDISLVAQTNGYSSHEEMSCTTSPEEKSETSDASGVGLAEVISQPCLAIHSEQSEFDQLIDLGQVEQSSNSHLDNFLINSDDLNSNIISPGKPFIAFEDNISKKQETSVTDLLS